MLYGTIAVLAIGAFTAMGLSETASNSASEPRVVPTPTEAPAESESPVATTETSSPDPEQTPTPAPQETATPQPEDTPTPSPSPTGPAAGTGDGAASATQDSGEADESAEEPAEPAQPGRPVELRIDKIGATAPFEWVGVTPEGDMQAPDGWNNAAWYEPGPAPGEQGNAVVAGHYDAPGGDPALFYQLRSLAPGDRVTIMTEHDEELTFEVTEVESVHVSEAPLKRIFGDTDQHNLNLITCEGAWDSSAGMYDQRLIVYTTLVSG